jgi:hypothetical protein
VEIKGLEPRGVEEGAMIEGARGKAERTAEAVVGVGLII